MFDKLGPYHTARLKSLSELVDVLAVESNPSNNEYSWSTVRVDPFPSLEYIAIEVNSAYAKYERYARASRVIQHIINARPDCVAVPGWSSLEALSLVEACSVGHIPLICMSASNRFDGPRRAITEFVKRGIVSHFSAGLATSPAQLDYLHELGMPREALFSGYNVVDNAYFAGAVAGLKDVGPMPEIDGKPMPEAARDRYFLVTCRFIEKKNLVRMLQAYAAFREERTAEPADWPLVLVGDGELRGELEFAAATLGVSAHVHFPGFRQYDELPYFYATAGAMLLPSTIEQWGLVVNEAMASGLAVAVSERCGCAAVLVEHGKTGLVFDPFDIAAITATLRRLASDPDRPRWAASGRERVEQLSPERFAHAVANLTDYLRKTGQTRRPRSIHKLLLRVAAWRAWYEMRSSSVRQAR